MFIAFTVVLGVIYPLAGLLVGQLGFQKQANGSLVVVNHRVVGTPMLAQATQDAKWFEPRPSAVGYSGLVSGASNLALSNPALFRSMKERAIQYRKENGLGHTSAVPIDAITTSGSGLDPDISLMNAYDQAPRVAKAQNLSLSVVHGLIRRATTEAIVGIMSQEYVNTVSLNIAIYQLKH